ncbi:TPA: hypothetical protein ACITFF_001806 [Salmonella enterica subsp. enterica serovar Virchow]
MSKCYRNSVGELTPGLVLPTHYQTYLRLRLADLEDAPSPADADIAKARANGAVEFAEVANCVDASGIERLFMLIEHTYMARIEALYREA